MKKIMKKAAACLLAVTTVMALTACGGNDAKSSTTAETAESSAEETTAGEASEDKTLVVAVAGTPIPYNYVDEDGNLCGDVDFEDVAENASVCTPVPGGVGSVTTSVLAKHLLKAAKARRA